MTKVLLSVEGQTEETFVRDVLQPHFGSALTLTPVLLKTRPVPDGPDFRGGYVTFDKMQKEVRRLLGDTNAVAVTTLYDLYGIPEGLTSLVADKRLRGIPKATALERAFQDKIDNPRFRAHLQVHEFEAFLFVDVDTTCRVFGLREASGKLQPIRAQFSSPEDIDDGVETAPSKRIKQAFPQYAKLLHGPKIAQEVGLEALRRTCRHFGDWLDWLESLVA